MPSPLQASANPQSNAVSANALMRSTTCGSAYTRGCSLRLAVRLLFVVLLASTALSSSSTTRCLSWCAGGGAFVSNAHTIAIFDSNQSEPHVALNRHVV